MKKIVFFLLFFPVLSHAQKLSYTIGGSSKLPANIALVLSNKIPIEGSVPKIITGLKDRGFNIYLVKEEINLSGVTLSNSPFAPEIKYALKINVLNQNLGEPVLNIEVQTYKLETGEVFSTQLRHPKENMLQLTADLAKELNAVLPKQQRQNDAQILSVENNEIIFSSADYPGLRKGDEITVRFAEARMGQTEIRSVIKRIVIATNKNGEFDKQIIAENKENLIQIGDKVYKKAVVRNRFSFTLLGTAPLALEKAPSGILNGLLYTGNSHWPAGFILQGEYERFLPYNFVSTTAFGLNIDSSFNTYLMSGVAWRARGSNWEFVPAFRLGLMYAPLSLYHGGEALQGSSIRLGLSLSLSFLYRFTDLFSMGFDIGLQYWFYSFSMLYQGNKKVEPAWTSPTIALPYLYPYLGLKFSWSF